MFNCLNCERTFEEYDVYRRHRSRVHKIHSSQTYVDVYLKGEWPKCRCGCGERVKWRPEMPSHFMDYVQGHNTRIDNPIHKLTPEQMQERAKKHSATNKAQFASGERKMWSEGRRIETDETLQRAAKKISENKERAEKISKSLTGVPKSEEHKAKSREGITKAWQNPELRERQRQHRMRMVTENGWEITSKLEDKFESMLQKCDIAYHRQHYVSEIKALYDFYLSDYKILIEVHGDYWHCNPETKHAMPKYECQLKNIKNDEKKRIWCELHGIPLLVFWESDILQRPDEVMASIKAELASGAK